MERGLVVSGEGHDTGGFGPKRMCDFREWRVMLDLTLNLRPQPGYGHS